MRWRVGVPALSTPHRSIDFIKSERYRHDFVRERITEEHPDRRRQRVRWWSALALLRALASSPAAEYLAENLRNALRGVEVMAITGLLPPADSAKVMEAIMNAMIESGFEPGQRQLSLPGPACAKPAAPAGADPSSSFSCPSTCWGPMSSYPFRTDAQPF